jgi:GntR family transcriptional regulator
MALVFSVSPASDVPIYRQVIQHVYRAVALGHLKAGEQLPAVRTLAENLIINPNTVARAYQELIRDGLAESRSGVGVFISERRPIFSKEERSRRLGQSVEQLVHEAKILDFSLSDAQAALEKQWRTLYPEKSESKGNTKGDKS